MDDLLKDFIAETRETLEAVAGEIVAWEADPGDRARLDTIFRFVHTVKGSCGFLDLPRLERLSHAAEEALASVRAGARNPDARLVSAILAIIDRIGASVDAIESGEAIDEAGDDPLIAALASAKSQPPAFPKTENIQRAPVRSIRVPVELLDRMMGGVSDLVLARNELSRQLRQIAGAFDLDAAFERLSATIAEMRGAITRTRMQRVEGLFAALPRLARDLSAELGKQVELELHGGDVELDREMIEMLRDPLTHIVRNALDHGFESPAERIASGKPAAGRLAIDARQSGNEIRISIADDGRGIDTDALISRAIMAGAIESRIALGLGRKAKLDLIFAPGLSTAEEGSSGSGRGAGMDVVRANVERIGGAVDIDSEAGQGTTIALNVPLTLSIIPALTASVGAMRYAVPRSAIREIVSLTGEVARIERIGGGELAVVRGERLPLARLARLIGLDEHGEAEDRVLIILQPTRRELYALAVSAVHDHEELVVKPAAPAVMTAGIYAGAALPDSGRPLLLLDAAGIATRAGFRFDAGEAPDGEVAAASTEAGASLLLFRDLDGATRAARLGLVERIMEVETATIRVTAGQPRIAIDGNLLPVIASGPLGERPTTSVLRLGDGAREIAYVVDEVTDVVHLEGPVKPARSPGRIAGVTLIGGEPVELLDGHYLFSEIGGETRVEGGQRTCLLDDDGDRWTREVLRPMIELAGYRVVGGDEAGVGAPDVIIRTGASSRREAGDALVVRLSATPGANDGSVYRYDRDGVLAALRSGVSGRGKG